MTGRRDSRTSMTSRQNDALFEFENFKKRFLVVNKQITKLNSSMSVRIEELNAQISSLYTENLRLRASEIALEAQLKREREKSRITFVEMEAALNKQLGQLRQHLGIPRLEPTTEPPPPPRAQTRPTIDPTVIRLSRQPTVSDISEHDDEELDYDLPRPHHSKSKRLSASKLPLPSRTLSPSPVPPMHMEIGFSGGGSSSSKSTKRKSSRRQSGLIVETAERERERPPSPAFGSPRTKGKISPVEIEGDYVIEEGEPDEEEDYRPVMSRKEGKMRLKDVTNHGLTSREFLATRSPSPVQLPTPRNSSSPTPPPEPESEGIRMEESEPEPTGRERRTRKSINYAEPKLNTKMRKPDGYVSSTKKRASSAIQRSDSEPDVILKPRRSSLKHHTTDEEGDDDRPPSRTSTNAETLLAKRKRSSATTTTTTNRISYHDYDQVTDEDESGDDADGDSPSASSSSTWVNTDGRRRVKSGERRHSSAV